MRETMAEQTQGDLVDEQGCKEGSASVSTGVAKLGCRRRLRYHICGEGQLLLLLHPAGASLDYWLPVMPLLAAHKFCAIALNIPDDNSEPHSGPSLHFLTETVIDAVDALGISVPFVAIGHQTGASIALLLAAAYPARVTRVICYGIPFLSTQDRQFAAYLQTQSGALAERGKQCWGSLAVASLDHTGLLSCVSQPTLCISGDNDPLQPGTMSTASRLVRGKYVHMAMSGICVVNEQTSAYVQNVVDFLLRM